MGQKYKQCIGYNPKKLLKIQEILISLFCIDEQEDHRVCNARLKVEKMMSIYGLFFYVQSSHKNQHLPELLNYLKKWLVDGWLNFNQLEFIMPMLIKSLTVMINSNEKYLVLIHS